MGRSMLGIGNIYCSRTEIYYIIIISAEISLSDCSWETGKMKSLYNSTKVLKNWAIIRKGKEYGHVLKCSNNSLYCRNIPTFICLDLKL